MGMLPEPDDVDIFVDGGDPDPESIRETVEFIKAYKQRPGYAEEVREAKRILEFLELNSPGYRKPDPAALYDQWRRTVEDLNRADQNGHANGKLP